MTASSDWLLWQLADSAFPSGGFAHSGGLEAAYQLGEIRSTRDLGRMLAESLDQAGHTTLPFVTASHEAPDSFEELALHCDATLPNHVANRASRVQGGALLASTTSAFALEPLRLLRARAAESEIPLHHAPVFGFVARYLGLPMLDAQRLWLFTHLRGAVSSAVRLGMVGPLEGQALQHRLVDTADNVLSRCASLPPDDVAQTNPLLDLFQGHHDRLYSRLFAS